MADTILVCDDEELIRWSICEQLHTEGFETIEAATGAACVEAEQQQAPQLILLDLKMPELDGLETLAELRKLGRPTKVILFSAMTDREAQRGIEALALGASDVMPKPSGAPPEGWGTELAPPPRPAPGRRAPAPAYYVCDVLPRSMSGGLPSRSSSPRAHASSPSPPPGRSLVASSPV